MRRMVAVSAGLIVSVCLGLFGIHGGQQKDQPRDYAGELPKIPPKTPQESLRSIQVKPGFRVDLVASEPTTFDPIAIDFDESGRMYVVEYPEYNQYAVKDFKDKGRVALLEDEDGDGTYEKRTVFADNLNGPSGVGCWDGGVFIASAPDVLWCKDTDGDGKADVREAVFTGFARDHAGEAMLNSFRWGLDNRMHLSTGLAGGDVRKAGDKDAKPVSVRGFGFLFDPRTRDFETTSGGGQYGMSKDDWGRTFVCSNSEPTHMIVYDGRYVARNPYLQAPKPAINIAPEGKYTKLFRISKVEPWRLLRTRLRKEGVVRGSDEGGEASGFFTGATGVTVYRGDAWPAEYRGNIIVGEVSGNLVYRARVEPKGVELVAHRADKGVEFLASSDNWFRPAYFANGPDGCLYVVDMYRELIEGAAFLPPEILKHMDIGGGLKHGRIYRIASADFKYAKPPRLGESSTAELVDLLQHPNGWHRDTASRLLYQRQDKSAVTPLRQLTSTSRSPLGRMHALYSLAGLGALREEDVLARLDDSDPQVRVHALRLSEQFSNSAAIGVKLVQLAKDPDLLVRYQLAFSLGAFPGTQTTRLLADLARRDGADGWCRLAILSSAFDRLGDLFSTLVRDDTFRATAHGKTILTTLAQQIGAADRVADRVLALKEIDALRPSDRIMSQALFQNLLSKMPAKTRATIQQGKTAELLGEILAQARSTATRKESAEADRVAAIRTLALGRFAEVRDTLRELLAPTQPVGVQTAVLHALTHFEDAEAARLILEAWAVLSPGPRSGATEAILSRPAWIGLFLDAVEKGAVARGDLDPARIQLLLAHPDNAIRTRAAKLFASEAVSKRAEVVAKYAKALELKGDLAKGKVVFKNQCSACHQLEGVGTSIGADLSAIRDRGLDAVMLNILDPNREVKPQFQSYFIETKKGQTLAGMIAEESASSVTLRKADGSTEKLLRIDIEELRSTGISFMPEGLEQQIDLQAMADLLAYLASIRAD